MNIIFDSILFWIFLGFLIFLSYYVITMARKIFEYEQQVDRGWNDLIKRADEMIKRMNEVLNKIENQKPKRSTKKEETQNKNL